MRAPVGSTLLALLLLASPCAAAEPAPALPPNLPQGWYASIETTMGTIVAHLLPEQAPQTVAHFAAFAQGRLEWVDPATGQTKKVNYYDGLKIHLAMAAQRFEAGDPTETGRGAPLIYVPPETDGPIGFEEPWRLGMTRASLGRISAALFFVTAAPLPYLNGLHPCFGEVVSGKEVVRAICGVKTGPRSKPIEPITIEHLRIVKVGDPAPIPNPVPYTPKQLKFGLKANPAPAQ